MYMQGVLLPENSKIMPENDGAVLNNQRYHNSPTLHRKLSWSLLQGNTICEGLEIFALFKKMRPMFDHAEEQAL